MTTNDKYDITLSNKSATTAGTTYYVWAKDKLGNRIKDIEDYPISESVYQKIETEIEKLDKVSSVERAKGTLDSKVIDYLIVVKGETTLEQAKEIGDKLLTYFDEKTLSYYSVQIFISKKDTSMNNFPIIGMKNPKTPKIIWTKDRDITKETDEDEK